VSEHEGVIVMVEHTIHAFDVDLQELARKIGEMGGLAEKQIMDAVEALVKHDITLAKRVIAADDQVDAQQRQIEERAVVAIARRQPMAVDLRQIVGALRISNDLERIGDLAENIAKRGMMTDELPSNAAILQFDRMVKLVLVQLRRVLHSYAQHDVAEALDVWHRDAEIDANEQFPVPGAPHLHDGEPAQYHLLHAFAFLRQEHRANGRSRHQYRRNRLLYRARAPTLGRTPEGRHYQ
jgi:phosphate transport system regulatory protein PhoU